MTTRVLLVEDNEVYRSSLELLLGLQAGLEVVGAVGSGDEAAEAALRLRADVVLMDYRLPGIDGAVPRPGVGVGVGYRPERPGAGGWAEGHGSSESGGWDPLTEPR